MLIKLGENLIDSHRNLSENRHVFLQSFANGQFYPWAALRLVAICMNQCWFSFWELVFQELSLLDFDCNSFWNLKLASKFVVFIDTALLFNRLFSFFFLFCACEGVHVVLLVWNILNFVVAGYPNFGYMADPKIWKFSFKFFLYAALNWLQLWLYSVCDLR